MGIWSRYGLLGLSVALVACQANVQKRACMGVDTTNPLVASAAVLHLQVFGGAAGCQGSTVAAGAGEPQLDRAFGRGQPIELDLPAGHYALLLTTFADVTETMAMGQGCTEASVGPGAQVCFELAVQAATPHGGACVSDYACVGAAGGSCCAASCADLQADVNNCGGCGRGCPQATTVGARCRAGACAFDSCQAGRLDCNQQVGDSCECAGTACCGAANDSCQAAHASGVGETIYDCTPLYTYTRDEADVIFHADTVYSGGALIFTCYGGNGSVDHATALCKVGSSTCICWWYDGAGAFASAPGLVSIDDTSTSCPCPDPSTNPHWY